jgi:hypothetical protein
VEKFYPFIPAMYSYGLLDKKGFLEGLVDFLDGYDDLAVDVPLAGKSTALLLSYILINASDVFDMTIFSKIPKENNFTDSTLFTDLIAQILQQVVEKISTMEAEKMYKESKLGSIFWDKLRTPEDLERVAEKYDLSFLKI